MNSYSELASFASYPITSLPVEWHIEAEGVRLIWDDQHISLLHTFWLRDNCPCSECVSPVTREQLFEICDAPADLHIRDVSLTAVAEQQRLTICWSDGHVSRMHPGWLRAHCYADAARQQRVSVQHTWDRQVINQHLPQHDYQQVMTNNNALLTWLKTQHQWGIAMIRNSPTEAGSLNHLAQRIGMIRETNFGRLFDVISRSDANSAAYTTVRLPLHTDLPTRELQPGLQFLHCLRNDAEGGESILVDGFRVAADLRQESPELYQALTRIPADFYNKDRHSDYRFRAPILQTDADGELTEVRVANFLRGPLDVSANDVELFYRAYRRFIEKTRDSRYQLYFRLDAGDTLVFDNRRVLHARNAFDLKSGGRHLQGCYVDRDELLSRIRILQRQQTVE